MVRRSFLALLSLTVFFVGCSKRPHPVYKGPELPPELAKAIDNARSITDLYHQIKVINLHTPDTVFLGDITAVHVNKFGQIAIIDRANTIPAVFDSSGNFLFFIGRHGRGPGEFLRASAVSYSESTKEWIVADNVTYEVSLFDDTGKFLSSFRTPSYVFKIHSDQSGHLYLFMPTRKVDYLVEERDYAGRLIKGFFSPTTLMRKLPFLLIGGGICGDDGRVFVAHQLSSSVHIFDSTGELISEFPLKSLADYIPPDESKIYETPFNPFKFLSSFTGVIWLSVAPYNVLMVTIKDAQRESSSESGRSIQMSQNTVAFFRQDGTLLGQCVSGPFSTVDSYGRLYRVVTPSSANENPRLEVWALKQFH